MTSLRTSAWEATTSNDLMTFMNIYGLQKGHQAGVSLKWMSHKE